MKYVLFVCTHNAGRSQMAQAFFERYAPVDIRAESAGQEPADSIWPNVLEAMREIGLELSGRRPKKLDLEMQLHADWAVTLACGGTCPYVPARVEEWDVPDPAGKSLEETRPIRDLIERRVKDLIEAHAADIRADRTAHALRLGKILPSLVEEFEGVRSPEEIRGCADAILGRYAEAPVRSFVLALAHSNARQCLREDVCSALTPAS
jgi:arsenate reductase (thioredoxin)